MRTSSNFQMFVPEAIFRSVSKLGTYAGFMSISNVKFSDRQRSMMFVYNVGMFIMFFFQIMCLLTVLIFRINILDDGSGVVCVLAIMINNCLLIIFYVVRRQRILKNYKDMLNIVKIIVRGPVHKKFIDSFESYTKYINKSILLYMMSVYVLLLAEFLVKGLSYAKIIYLIPDKGYLIYVMPWSNDNVFFFWITLSFETISTFLMTIVQQANHYYIMTMMILHTLCFRYLKVSLAHIISSNRKLNLKNVSSKEMSKLQSYYDGRTRKILRYWSVLHNQLIRVCREFVIIYTPLLVSYFTVMVVTLVCGVFSITQNDHYYGVAEELLLALYFAGIILNLLMLCTAGSNLSVESQQTFEDAFQAPWYDCSKEVQSSLKIICAVSQKPIRIAAFGSHKFYISLHTFILVMKAMASVYVGLAQMKLLAKTRSGES